MLTIFAEKTKKETRKFTVFIVDDEQLVRSLLLFRLKKRSDLVLHSWSNGEDCVEHLGLMPDVVILDFHLDAPDGEHRLNGLDTLRVIKEISPDTQVAMLSSQDDVQVAVDTLRMGAASYMVKDVAFAESAELTINRQIQAIQLREYLHELQSVVLFDNRVLKRLLMAFCIAMLLMNGYYFYMTR